MSFSLVLCFFFRFGNEIDRALMESKRCRSPTFCLKNDNPVQDILPLTGLKKLKELYVPLKLPKENLEKFKKLRPDVKISF
ncbi:hypothetical protein [Leptospira santarosai]|uniref:Uncharacterized protein n=1 Tax=Leptospira santarosai str. MOR084 TaxID=1049984 RepID=A0A0E2BP70_9LEPT|nr:hypothetical protein [Leptospira santarosai]EKO33171.1 hypothetical protein LEP1GSC179_4130 [Leptospira santarosai str. MOR084]